MCSSSSEARRQILGGAVRIDGKKIMDPNLEFDSADDLIGKILQVGKKKFVRISIWQIVMENAIKPSDLTILSF